VKECVEAIDLQNKKVILLVKEEDTYSEPLLLALNGLLKYGDT